MSILVNSSSKVVIQGAAGIEGQFHMKKMIEYGTKVVAGVDPAFIDSSLDELPAYTTLQQAVEEHNPDISIIFVPAPFAFDAISESVENGIKIIVVVTEGMPVNDMIKVKQYLSGKNITLIGPNCPGLISPEQCKVGIMPGHIHKKGSVGIISRSGTLTYEVVQALTNADIGQSTCIGIGGDPVQGSNFIDILKLFKDDPETKSVAIIGEIGGVEEEKAAKYIAEEFNKPVAAFIAGKTAPPEKRMGHAGAIISGGRGTAAAKIKALNKAGIDVASIPEELVDIIKRF